MSEKEKASVRVEVSASVEGLEVLGDEDWSEEKRTGVRSQRR